MTAAARAAERLLRWADTLEPALRNAVLDAWARVRLSVSLPELLRRLRVDDIDGVVELLFESPDARAAEVAVRNLYTQAAQALRTRVIRAMILRVEAPVADAALIAHVRTWEDQAFRRLRDDVRVGLREQVATELTRGVGPRQIALALKGDVGRVGLTAYDHRIVESYRRALVEGRTGAVLRRALRDRRFDRTIARGPLTDAQIETMVNAYRRKLVAFRAETFARTSALDAANAATSEAWEAAVAQGTVPLDEVRRYWIVAQDERLCPTCAPIPGLNPNGVGLRELFNTPDGLRQRPTMHPNCRCTTWIRRARPHVIQRPQPGTTRLILPKLGALV